MPNQLTPEQKAVLAKIKFPVRYSSGFIYDANNNRIATFGSWNVGFDLLGLMFVNSLNSQFANHDKEKGDG